MSELTEKQRQEAYRVIKERYELDHKQRDRLDAYLRRTGGGDLLLGTALRGQWQTVTEALVLNGITPENWFDRAYGAEYGEAARTLRHDLNRARRWTARDYARVAWNWTSWIVINFAINFVIIYTVVTLAGHLKSC